MSHSKKFDFGVNWKIISPSLFFQKKKSLTLWDTILKESWILWVIFEKKVQFFDLCQNLREKDQSLRHIQEKRFNSLRHIPKTKSSILWVNIQKKVQFFESSCKKERFNFYDSSWKEGFNSVSHMEKWFSSVSHVFSSKSSILRDICEKKVQFFEFCEAYFIRKTLWVVIQKSFCESCSKKGSILCHFVKRVQFFESPSEECSILWVKFLKIRFNSLSHIPKKEFNSVSRVRVKRMFNSLDQKSVLQLSQFLTFFNDGFNSLRHEQKGKFFGKNIQFFWVPLKKGFNSLSQIEKNNPLSHIPDKVQVFESFWAIKRVVQFFESYSECSILSVVFLKKKKKVFDSVNHMRKKSSLLGHINQSKKFNPLSRILWIKQKVQFFESYWKKVQSFEEKFESF